MGRRVYQGTLSMLYILKRLTVQMDKLLRHLIIKVGNEHYLGMTSYTLLILSIQEPTAFLK